MDMQENEISYCGSLVRRNDKDKFLLSMFMPAKLREDIWALFAFNYEIAKTREVVSDATLGLMRLQWWRDSIASIYNGGNIADHEVLKPLSVAIKRHDLPLEHFDKLIYAREFDLEDVLPANIEGLINYADYTTTPLFTLAVMINGDDIAQDIVRSVAVNFSLVGLLRSCSHNARQGRYLLPQDLMDKYDVTKEIVFDEAGQAGLRNIVADVVSNKLDNYKHRNIVLKGAQAFSDIYFRQISALNYDVMSPKLQREPAFKVLRLFWKIKVL